MNNRNRKNTSSNSTLAIATIALIVLLNAASGAISGDGIFGLIVVMLFLGIAGLSVGMMYTKKKGGAKRGSVYNKERAKETAKHIFMREEFEEEAVKCTHPRGKEKYFAQLDNFLANGLIDKAEYRVLKERYEKAKVPENMH